MSNASAISGAYSGGTIAHRAASCTPAGPLTKNGRSLRGFVVLGFPHRWAIERSRRRGRRPQHSQQRTESAGASIMAGRTGS